MKPRRPTALPPPAAPESAPPAPPSAARTPTRLPSNPMPATAAAARPAAQPTRVQGVARQGLDVPMPELQRRFPGLGYEEAEAVQRVLRGVVPGALTLREATLWGSAEQERYGQRVEQALQLGQEPRRVAAQQHVARLHELLAEVAEAIQAQLEPGLLSRWRTDPWELLARHRPEIEQLRVALAGAAQELAAQRDALHGLRRGMQELGAVLQAQALAATWLAETQPPAADARLGPTLLRRATELGALQAHIAQGHLLREQADADLDALCGAVQQAVGLLLPGWLEKALHTRQRSTPTATRELGRELDGLLHLLPTLRS